MPKNNSALANALIDAYQDALRPGGWANWQASRASPVGLKVHEFPHGSAGTKVRGLSTATDVHEGEEVLVLPPALRLVRRDIEAPRFLSSEKGRLAAVGLWLAEKRAEYSKNPKGLGLEPREQFWNSYIRSLPTLSEYVSSGLPMAALSSDLDTLEKLPILGETMAPWAKNEKKDVLDTIARYNAERGERPKLSEEDALWGRAVSQTRGFLGWDLPTLLPVGDFLNSGRKQSNVGLEYDADSGDVVFIAKRDLHAGEELTYNYSADNDDSLGMLLKYGIVEDDKQHIERWPLEMCTKLSKARLWEARDGPLLSAVGKLVRQSCSASGSQGAAAVATKPPEGLVQQGHASEAEFKYPGQLTWHFVPRNSIWEPAEHGDASTTSPMLTPPKIQAPNPLKVSQQALLEQAFLLGPVPLGRHNEYKPSCRKCSKAMLHGSCFL